MAEATAKAAHRPILVKFGAPDGDIERIKGGPGGAPGDLDRGRQRGLDRGQHRTASRGLRRSRRARGAAPARQGDAILAGSRVPFRSWPTRACMTGRASTGWWALRSRQHQARQDGRPHRGAGPRRCGERPSAFPDDRLHGRDVACHGAGPGARAACRASSISTARSSRQGPGTRPALRGQHRLSAGARALGLILLQADDDQHQHEADGSQGAIAANTPAPTSCRSCR